MAGDLVESAARAEDDLEETYISDYHQDVTIPALLLAQNDFDRGVLDQSQSAAVARTAAALVTAIAPLVDEELADEALQPVGTGTFSLLVAGGRSRLDDASAKVLAQALRANGITVSELSRADLVAGAAPSPEGSNQRCLILSYLDPHPPRGGLLLLRRIKRADPSLRVGVVFWDMPAALHQATDPMIPRLRLAEPATELALEIGADFVVRTIADAMAEGTRDVPARPLPATVPKRLRNPARPRVLPEAA